MGVYDSDTSTNLLRRGVTASKMMSKSSGRISIVGPVSSASCSEDPVAEETAVSSDLEPAPEASVWRPAGVGSYAPATIAGPVAYLQLRQQTLEGPEDV